MPFRLDVALEPAAKGAWNLILDLEIAPGIGWSRRARRTSQPCRRHLWQGFPRAGALVQPLETTVTVTRNPEEGCQVVHTMSRDAFPSGHEFRHWVRSVRDWAARPSWIPAPAGRTRGRSSRVQGGACRQQARLR